MDTKFQVSSLWESKVNETQVAMRIAPSKRLLDILREDLQLTGTKVSCEMGRCSACMVLVDGQAVNACLTMAYQCSGKEITTIEGLANDQLHPIQQAFLEEGGFQRGYCTPGMIISIEALLTDNPQPNQQAIEEGLCGNLCRCTGYGGIVRAVEKAELTGDSDVNPTLDLPCADVFARGNKSIKVMGPFPEIEAEVIAVHLGYW